MKRLVALTALVLLGPATVEAHPLAPSLLDIRETAPGRAEVRWKTPLQSTGAVLTPVLPVGCAPDGAIRSEREASGLVASWTVACSFESLVGRPIAVDGIGDSRAGVLVRIGLLDGRTIRALLGPEAPALVVPERESTARIASGYLRLGVEHILTGLDHLLFVLGLLLLVEGRRRLVGTVTAFTAGHSVTLSLAVLGFVDVPPAPVEALIATSILVLAVELVRPRDTRPGLFRRRPWLVAGAFGFLHGLGFAGALAEVGLPAGEIPLALFSFNAGIEVGQLAFIAAVLLARGLARRLPVRWPAATRLVPAYTIGSLAAFWLIERTTRIFVD